MIQDMMPQAISKKREKLCLMSNYPLKLKRGEKGAQWIEKMNLTSSLCSPL